MLRYYEDLGFIQSQRKGDGAYRVYDDNAINRLRQIIILRKLRISIKQIGEILNNRDAAVIIDIFNQNINDLDDEIASLATIKTILTQFTKNLSKAAQIKLEVDFAADNSVLSAIETLSYYNNLTLVFIFERICKGEGAQRMNLCIFGGRAAVVLPLFNYRNPFGFLI